MIIGIGTDIIEIRRIQSAIRNKRFIERCFSLNEIKMLKARKFPVQSIAAGFAAKEAVAKALGTGVRGIRLKDIEVLRDKFGKPYINLYGYAKKFADKLGIDEIQVSLSHSKSDAIAFVIAKGR